MPNDIETPVENLKVNRLICAGLALATLTEQTALNSYYSSDEAWPSDWAIADPDGYQCWHELKIAIQAFHHEDPQ